MSNIKSTGRRIWKEIDRAKTILLHLHPGPDGDSIGSSLAFYHVLRKMRKKVTLISGDSPLPQRFSTLPGVKHITHKTFSQLNLSDYDLFIIHDSSAPHQITRSEPVVFPKTLKTIIIDHHFSSEKFADINLVLPKYTSTAQVLYDLFQLKKIKITKNVAACLFIGIYTDTGAFKYFNPTYKTFNIASKLAKIYPKFPELIFALENNDHPDYLKFISLALDSVENHLNNRLVITSVSYQQIKDNKLDINEIHNYSVVTNMTKGVIGWDIAITLVETKKNFVKVNFRTRDSDTFNLAKIATATGAGGGHRAAAGATIKKSLPETKKFLIKIIKKLYPKIDR
jgi:bifunctional oligoribonuclease and PAP phosphatase NrnA